MSRSFPLFAIILFGIVGLFVLGSTRASDNEPPKAVSLPFDEPNVRDLVDRIEALEKRLATLEQREQLVRQADARDESRFVQPSPLRQEQRTNNGSLNENNNEPRQSTNGQAWKIRLLGGGAQKRPES